MPQDRQLVLISMSGVRIRDQELLAFGMTLPGFVDRGEVIASLPALGLLTLAAHTPRHWEVIYLEVDDSADEATALQAALDADLVGISALSARIFDAYALADRIRQLGTPVAIGGLHASALPDEAQTHADTVVAGEGEAVWATLLQDLEQGQLQPRYDAKAMGRSFNLRQAKVPRYDLLAGRAYNRITLQTARGCPLDCVFCGASRIISAFKTKPLDRISDELDAIEALWPRPFLELSDDNTFAAKGWGRDLMRLFARRNLRWFTETDLSVADDEALLEAIAEAGCAQLLIGLESTSARALAGLDGRNWKARQVDRQLEAVRRIQSYGIPVNGCFILGLDDDEQSFRAIQTFVEASGLCDVQITLLTPFPGTALHRQLKQQGRLLREVYWDQCTLFDLTFRPSRMSPEALMSGFRGLMKDLYDDTAKARRTSAFRACLKTGRALSIPDTGDKPA